MASRAYLRTPKSGAHPAAPRPTGSYSSTMSTSGNVDLACTFCGRPQRKVSKLIAGPHAAICDACVELAEHVVSSSSAAGTPLGQMYAVLEKDGQARCSFCDKQRYQVTGLAAMPVESRGKFSEPAAICVECLSLCNEIIADEPA